LIDSSPLTRSVVQSRKHLSAKKATSKGKGRCREDIQLVLWMTAHDRHPRAAAGILRYLRLVRRVQFAIR
jgi:hypothetical protein